MDAEHIREYLLRNDSETINTDDNAYLEYRTPFEFTENTESIVRDLVPFAGWDVNKLVPDLPADAQQRVRDYFGGRRDVLVSELSDPIE
jgi:hypothetical protein